MIFSDGSVEAFASKESTTNDKEEIVAAESLETQEISMSKTKREMVDAYNILLKKYKEKQKSELKPEKQKAEMKKREVVTTAESLSVEKVVTDINSLKYEISNSLITISDRLEKEVHTFQDIKSAIEAKEQELKEIYDIERESATLAALIESQNQKKSEYEAEMSIKRENLSQVITSTREEWEKEKKENKAIEKEIASEEQKKRKREKDDFYYNLQREQQLTTDKYLDEKAKQEKELKEKKEAFEKDFSQREKDIVLKESELNELRKKAAEYPKELESAVTKAVEEITEKLLEDAKSKEVLLKKTFDGEKNVLTTRVESLESTVEKQNEQINKLSHQLEMSYQKVQDIALKTVEGSSNTKTLSNIQHLLDHQEKKAIKDT